MRQVTKQVERRKFLKAIYEIQDKFGVVFAGISRTFSFGIKPTLEQERRLEEWFRQVVSAKTALYQEIFEHFKESPNQYLGNKFEYSTFFKGSAVFRRAKEKYPLFTSEPIGEGLRMELAIPSFITNHKLHFEEATQMRLFLKSKYKRTVRLLASNPLHLILPPGLYWVSLGDLLAETMKMLLQHIPNLKHATFSSGKSML